MVAAAKNVYQALAAAQAELGPIKKTETAKVATKTGGSYSYTYADLATVLGEVMPVLHKHGLTLSQPTDIVAGTMVLRTVLAYQDGESMIEGVYPISAANMNDPQAIGSAITFARRYALLAILGLGTVDDDDGQAARTAPSDRPHHRRPQPASAINGAPDDPGTITPTQLQQLWIEARKVFGGDEAFRNWVTKNHQVTSTKTLSYTKAREIITELRKMLVESSGGDDTEDPAFYDG